MKSEMMRCVCVTVFVLMAVGTTSTLSTFGTNKNTDTDNKTPPPPIIKGRECKTESDCKSIQNVLCMRDPRDGRKRCLCVNKSSPSNGACPQFPKALKSTCNADKDCIDGAHCSTQMNSSSTAKSCMCQEGFYEEDYMCNAGFLTTAPSAMSLLIAFSILCLARKSDSTF